MLCIYFCKFVFSLPSAFQEGNKWTTVLVLIRPNWLRIQMGSKSFVYNSWRYRRRFVNVSSSAHVAAKCGCSLWTVVWFKNAVWSTILCWIQFKFVWKVAIVIYCTRLDKCETLLNSLPWEILAWHGKPPVLCFSHKNSHSLVMIPWKSLLAFKKTNMLLFTVISTHLTVK